MKALTTKEQNRVAHEADYFAGLLIGSLKGKKAREHLLGLHDFLAPKPNIVPAVAIREAFAIQLGHVLIRRLADSD